MSGVFHLVTAGRTGGFNAAEQVGTTSAPLFQAPPLSVEVAGLGGDSHRALERAHPVSSGCHGAQGYAAVATVEGALGFWGGRRVNSGGVWLQSDESKGEPTKRDEWLTNRGVSQELKDSTEPQQLLVLLTEKPDRPAADNQLLAALVRLEQANDCAVQARLAARS